MKTLVFFNILTRFFFFFICIFFALKSFDTKYRFGKVTTYLLAALYIVLSLGVVELFLEPFSYFLKWNGIAAAIWIVLSVAFALFLFKTNILELTFFVLVIMTVQTNVIFIANALHKLALFPEIAGSYELTHLALSAVVMLLLTPLMWYLYIGLFKKVVELSLAAHYWRWIVVLPFSFLVFCWVSIANPVSRTDLTPVSTICLLLAVNVFAFFSYVAVLKMLVKTHESLAATEKAELSEQMLVMQAEQYSEISDHIEKTAHLRHDFRHHMIVLRGFAESGDLEGLSSYLSEYVEESAECDAAPICANHYVDIILRHYAGAAKADGVALTISADFAEDFSLPDTELCVLLGNLFENAVESCARQKSGEKTIALVIKSVSAHTLAITITNSYEGEIRSRGGRFLSSKRTGDGLGTETVRAIAEKCGGSCDFYYANGKFTAKVLLIS